MSLKYQHVTAAGHNTEQASIRRRNGRTSELSNAMTLAARVSPLSSAISPKH